MKILALERELDGADPAGFRHFAAEEARRAWDLYQAGYVRELYFRTDQHTAVLVLECETVERAVDLLSTLPFVREGMIAFDLIPLKAYSGFGRLFSDGIEDEMGSHPGEATTSS
jgi:muconolactone delta-isomerase